MEYKVLPSYTKAIEGRSVTGVFAVMGNIDDYGDRLWPGAFLKTFAERGPQGGPGGKIRFLWSHDFWSPPVAVVTGLRELNRVELPDAILQRAPEAVGGAEITRTYLETPRGEEILEALRKLALDEMSFGFDALKFDFEAVGEQRLRNVREVRMWESSDVLWGANDATLGQKAWLPLDRLVGQIEAYLQELRAGARHSAKDTTALNTIHQLVVDLGTTQCKGIVADEDEADEADTDKAADREESRAAMLDTALTLWSNELAELELALVTL